MTDCDSETSSSQATDDCPDHIAFSLMEDQNGVPQIPYAPNKDLVCPFHPLGCSIIHSSNELDEWVAHSMTHFRRGKRKISPPKTSTCPSCRKEFRDDNAAESWRLKMSHMAESHGSQSTLPDFDLFLYLWKQGLIKQDEYRDLWGPSKPVKSTQHGARTKPGERTANYVQVNERRPKRH